jgi:hypothetical protein
VELIFWKKRERYTLNCDDPGASFSAVCSRFAREPVTFQWVESHFDPAQPRRAGLDYIAMLGALSELWSALINDRSGGHSMTSVLYSSIRRDAARPR